VRRRSAADPRETSSALHAIATGQLAFCRPSVHARHRIHLPSGICETGASPHRFDPSTTAYSRFVMFVPELGLGYWF